MCGVLKSKYIYKKIIINSYTKIDKKILYKLIQILYQARKTINKKNKESFIYALPELGFLSSALPFLYFTF